MTCSLRLTGEGAGEARALLHLRLRALRVEPLDQRIPLLPIGPGEVRRQLVDAEPALIRADVVLRLAEARDVRHPQARQRVVELLEDQDRKSTRLNSSHRCISYAV